MNAYDPLRDLERFANNLFEGARRGPRRMPMDLYRDGDQYVLTADLPGIDPESVDVKLDGQLLTIRAERTVPAGDDKTWITRERESGTFLRQLSLGQGIDTDGISAEYRNGVLTVTLPVSDRAKSRKVAVKTGDDQPALRVEEKEPAAVTA